MKKSPVWNRPCGPPTEAKPRPRSKGGNGLRLPFYCKLLLDGGSNTNPDVRIVAQKPASILVGGEGQRPRTYREHQGYFLSAMREQDEGKYAGCRFALVFVGDADGAGLEDLRMVEENLVDLLGVDAMRTA